MRSSRAAAVMSVLSMSIGLFAADEVTFSRPYGGSVHHVGDTMRIEFTVSDSPNVSFTPAVMVISADSFFSKGVFPMALNGTDSISILKHYDWVVDSTVSDIFAAGSPARNVMGPAVIIGIIPYPGGGANAWGNSNAFSILPPRPCPGTPVKGNGAVLRDPNGCEVYRVGDTMTLSWDLDSANDGVLFKFSPDDMLNAVIIGNVLGSSPSYMHGPKKWVIPDSVFSSDGFTRLATVSDQCIIRVYEYWKMNIADQSDRVFTILPAGSPNGVVPRGITHTGRPGITVSRRMLSAVFGNETGKLTVTTSSGQVVLSQSGQGEVRCSLDKLPAGVYFAAIESTGSRISQSLMVR